MSIVDYSEKSFVVVGAPSQLWESLAEMGGLFNTKLKNIDDGKGRGWGWVFSNKKLTTLRTFLGNPQLSYTTIATTSKTPVKTKTLASTVDTSSAKTAVSDFPVPDKTMRKYISLMGYGTAYKEMTEEFGDDPNEMQSTDTIMMTPDRFNKQIQENTKTLKDWIVEDSKSK